MKKIVFVLSLLITSLVSQAQFNCSQIKIDGVTITCSGTNKLQVDTVVKMATQKMLSLKLSWSDTITKIATKYDLSLIAPAGVTSVGLALPAEFSISGSPVTTTGTLTGSWASQSAFTVLGRASGSGTPSFLSMDTTFISNFYLKVRGLLSGTSPISYSSTTGIISIGDAAADGTTKGASAYTASDFNTSAGVVSIDYTNGQAASGSTKGFLIAADWTTFNNKQATISVTSPITLTGASVGIVNQGTTTQVLHGNAAGNASFSAVSLANDVSGVLTGTNGGTGANNGANVITVSGNLTTTGSFNTTLATGFTGTITMPNATSTLATLALTETFTNKRITKRTGTTSSSATPTINTDNVDFYSITALSAAITSFTTNLSGTPTEAQTLWIAITDNGTARAIAWGASFEASGTVALPTTTVLGVRLDVGFVWNTVTSKWRCVAVS